MRKAGKTTINVQGTAVTILGQAGDDSISLTDIAKYREPDRQDIVIQNWMRNRNTVEFLGIWERLHNPDFNPIEFVGFRKRAGLNSFVLTPRQWIEQTRAIGLQSKSGRYGGTFAHQDIAFEFASWISVEFKLYLIKEFQRLKEDEYRRLSLTWNLNRTLSKLNYRIHTDAIQAHLIPAVVTPAQAAMTYASEADLLNVALFGQTAKQWRDANPCLVGAEVLNSYAEAIAKMPENPGIPPLFREIIKNAFLPYRDNLSGERYRENGAKTHIFPLVKLGEVCTVNPRKSQLAGFGRADEGVRVAGDPDVFGFAQDHRGASAWKAGVAVRDIRRRQLLRGEPGKIKG